MDGTSFQLRFTTCLLAGALGDALGAPIEFASLDTIRIHHGPQGLTGLVSGEFPAGSITDDTQMTLFTAEGVLRAWVRLDQRGVGDPVGVVHHAYLRWLHTQGLAASRWEDVQGALTLNGWLIKEKRLFSRRAPGNTCLRALAATTDLGQLADNDRKGCGGVMRVAPAAMLDRTSLGDRERVFDYACDLAHLTHGHPTGYLSAGVLGAILDDLVYDHTLDDAVANAMRILATYDHHDETTRALEAALAAAANVDHDADPAELAVVVETLGKGWVAEEALAIAAFCALVSPDDIRRALLLAVNHSGDSDSTGAICGNIVGAANTPADLPADWLAQLELRKVIETLANDLANIADGSIDSADEELLNRYPGE